MTEVDERPLDAVIAEFSAIRAEIGYRSTTQHLLMNLNIIATGAVVGLAARGPDENVLLLLLVAIVSSALGILYADHARAISVLAGYVDEKMRFERDGRVRKLFPWEEYSRCKEKDRPFYLKFPIAIVLVFVIPPSVALTFLRQRGDYLDKSLSEVAWFLGLVLTVYMTLILVTVLITGLKPRDPSARRRFRRPVGRRNTA